jgi:ABC-type uncharacterized transport system substrate-binding protein
MVWLRFSKPDPSMIRRLAIALAAAATAMLPQQASAHPHVYVVVKSELVYGPDGAVTAIKHAWTFDDMFSVYAVQGLETKQKGVYTREDLAPLAEVNVTSMKEYDYFTHIKADGKKVALPDAKDYWLEYKDSMLTLYFTLPLKAGLKPKVLEVDVYDPEYFVDLSFDEKDPAKLAGAPGQCALAMTKPEPPAPVAQTDPQRLDRAFRASEAFAGMGGQFASKISVKCQ